MLLGACPVLLNWVWQLRFSPTLLGLTYLPTSAGGSSHLIFMYILGFMRIMKAIFPFTSQISSCLVRP